MQIFFQKIDPFLSLMVISDLIKRITSHYKMGLQIANLREKCKDNKPAYLATITKLNMNEFWADMLEAFAMTLQKTHNVKLLSNTEELEKSILCALISGSFSKPEDLVKLAITKSLDELIIFICLTFNEKDKPVFLEIPRPDVKISSTPLETQSIQSTPSTPSQEDIIFLSKYAVTTPNPFFKELYEAES